VPGPGTRKGMSLPTHKMTGTILSVAPRSEQLCRVDLICPDGFVGVTAPRKTACPFGPFDHVEIVANIRGRGFFLSEIHLLKRPEVLARNMRAFNEAARLVRLMQLSFVHLPDYHEICAIFNRAIDNYQHGAASAVVTLKAFYKMLSSEGFPVGEGWLNTLDGELGEKAQTLLKAPLEGLPADEGIRILESLILWTQGELGVRLDP